MQLFAVIFLITQFFWQKAGDKDKDFKFHSDFLEKLRACYG